MFNLTRVLGLLWVLMAQGCQSPSILTLSETAPGDVETAVRSVLKSYESTRDSEGTFRTGWEEEPLNAVNTRLPAGARWLRVRYEVSLEGKAVEVRARAEVFVHHGPHRKTWDWVNARPFEEKLLWRIVEALKRESGAK